MLQGLGDGGPEGVVGFAYFRVDEFAQLSASYVVEVYRILDDVIAMFGVDVDQRASFVEVLAVVDGRGEDLPGSAFSRRVADVLLPPACASAVHICKGLQID